jgi:hypothetical protein
MRICPSPPTDIPYFVPAHHAVFGHDCLSYQDAIVADVGVMVECLKAAREPSNLAGRRTLQYVQLRGVWTRGPAVRSHCLPHSFLVEQRHVIGWSFQPEGYCWGLQFRESAVFVPRYLKPLLHATAELECADSAGGGFDFVSIIRVVVTFVWRSCKVRLTRNLLSGWLV